MSRQKEENLTVQLGKFDPSLAFSFPLFLLASAIFLHGGEWVLPLVFHEFID